MAKKGSKGKAAKAPKAVLGEYNPDSLPGKKAKAKPGRSKKK